MAKGRLKEPQTGYRDVHNAASIHLFEVWVVAARRAKARLVNAAILGGFQIQWVYMDC